MFNDRDDASSWLEPSLQRSIDNRGSPFDSDDDPDLALGFGETTTIRSSPRPTFASIRGLSPNFYSSFWPSATGSVDYSTLAAPSDDDDESDHVMVVDETGYPKAPLENGATGVNPKGRPRLFVHKLYLMLEDPEASAYIQWGQDGHDFVVTNQEEFAKKVLSKYFKHPDFIRFVRWLNVHDFHRINRASRSQRGTNQPQIWNFSHPKFRRGRADLLHGIKPKQKENFTFPLSFGTDQPPGERRPSSLGSVAGMRSPPSGATNQESIPLGLKMRNRIHLGSRGGYKEPERDRNQPRPQSQQLHNSREPVRAGIMAHASTRPNGHVLHVHYNPSSSIGPYSSQQDDLTSPSTDSQSAVDRFPSTGPPNAFASVSESSRRTHFSRTNAPLSIPTTIGQVSNSGSSGYQPGQRRSTPITHPNYVFQGISYDPLAPQVAEHLVKASPPSPRPSQ